MKTRRNLPRRQAGLTLIEILIALLVIAVGLLSTASLQLLSKRSNYDAAQRTSAAHLAQDLLERMRSNPQALIDYLPAGTLGGASQGAAPAVDCGAAGMVCTPPELAAYDLWQWEQLLDGALEQRDGNATGGLVDPRVCIRGPVFGATGVYEVAIAWRGLTESANPATDACGAGNYGANDAYRRVMVMRTFINAG
jgi:type IV pilus assembly protein PilV